MPNDMFMAAVLLLLIIIAMLILIAMLNKNTNANMAARVNNAIDGTIQRLDAAIEHHAEIDAILAIIKQIDDGNFDAVELLKQFPEKLCAAAWLYTINKLGADIEVETSRLSGAHRTWGAHNNYTIGVQASLDAMRAKLNAAIAASAKLDEHVV